MSFNISLSGLNAAQKDLDVTSNNIANVATTGFKKSRAEFADVYTRSIFANAKTIVGSGVQTASVTQQFSQGSIENTDNTLDLAISGEGYFVLHADGSEENIYTRAGNFQVDAEGNVVSTNGYNLQIYSVDDDGEVSSLSLASTRNLVIPTDGGTPAETTKVTSSMSLNSSETLQKKGKITLDVVEPERTSATITEDPTVNYRFDPNDPESYSHTTSVPVYDSLGNQHTATYYFVNADKLAITDSSGRKSTVTAWQVYVGFEKIDDDGNSTMEIVDLAKTNPNSNNLIMDSGYSHTDAQGHQEGKKVTCGVILFNASGEPVDFRGEKLTGISFTTEYLGYNQSGVEPGEGETGYAEVFEGVNDYQQVTFDFEELTQVSSPFDVTKLVQNGSSKGQLTGLDISDDGLVQATYSNGKIKKVGMIAMATFSNSQGLAKLGDTCWKQSINSGEAVASRPGIGIGGFIKSSSLESSNVDLSASLVDLITAQRHYQANSKALEAASAIMQTILNVS
jgi:flagellar hook protein FlgE